MTGTRSVSSLLKVACRPASRSGTAARPSGLVSSIWMAPPNTSSAMPAEKCLPVLDSTSTRASCPRFRWSSTASSSRQNAGPMVFIAWGRFSTRWAMWSSVVS